MNIKYNCPRCEISINNNYICKSCQTNYSPLIFNNIKILDFLSCNINPNKLKCFPFSDIYHKKKEILNQFSHYQNKIILDVGCREGVVGEILAKKNYVIGLDISPNAMLYSNPNILDKGYSELLLADATNIPLSKNQIDLIIATDILEHLLQPEKALGEFHKVLKKDGKVIITVPNLVSYNNRISILIGSGIGLEIHKILQGRSPIHPIAGARYPDQTKHLRFFSLKSLKHMFEQNGFKIIKTFGYDPVFSRIPLADIILKNFCLLVGIVAEKQ